MKKLYLIIFALAIFAGVTAQTDTITFPTGMSELAAPAATDVFLVDDGDSAQWVSLQDIMDYLEGNMALETLLTKTIGGTFTVTGSYTNMITFRASQPGLNSARMGLYLDGAVDLKVYNNDDYSGSETNIQVNEQNILLQLNNSGAEKMFQISQNYMRITDEEDTTGLIYYRDYSAAGRNNPQWLASIAAVRAEISDSLAAFISGADSTYNQAAIDSMLNLKEDALGNPGVTGYVLSSTTGGVRSWVAQSGGGGGTGGYSLLEFIIGTTVNAPSAGDSLLTHEGVFDKYLEVFRSSEWGDVNMQRYRDTLGYELSDSTVIFHPVFASGDYIRVQIRDSTDITSLALRDTSTYVPPSGEYPAYLDTDTIESWYISEAQYVTLVGDTGVSAWMDIKGNHNLAQANTAYQPIFRGDSITYDGVNDFIYTSDQVLNDTCTVYMAIQTNSYVAGGRLFSSSSSHLIEQAAANYIRQWAGGEFAGKSGITNGHTHIMTFRWVSGGTSGLTIDGDTETTFTAGTITPGTYMYIGSHDSGVANTTVKEVIISNVNDSAARRTEIYNYLNGKY